MSPEPPDPGATLDRLLRRAADFPEAGLRFVDRREQPSWFSWGEIERRARAVAHGLRTIGLRPGQCVGLVFPTGPEFMDGFFGTLLAGGVPVPLYPPVRLGRLEEYHRRTARMLQAVEAPVVLADGRVRRLLGETIALARPPLGCAGVEELAVLGARADRPVRAGRAQPGKSPQDDLPAVSADDLALVQFSSGTTVDPKPVALTHRAILAQVRLLNGFWPDDEQVVHSGVSWLPLYHDMGLIGCVFPALERPAVLTLLGPDVFVTQPALWLRTISRYRATVSPAPNFAYGLCVQKVRPEELEGVDLSSWRVALNGAEAVAPEVLRAFEERFAPHGLSRTALTPVYGLSEAALAVTFSDPHGPVVSRRFDREALARQGEAREAAGGLEIVSVGRPLPGFDLEIRDEAGRPLAEGLVGRLWIRGPSLMAGYLNDPQATARVFRGGWLDTGDLGFLHQGQLYLTGRAKDMVLLRGRNYAPQQIEQAVDGVAGVRTGCAVAGSFLPEGAEGERLVLLVEAQRQATAQERQRMPEECARAVLAAVGLRPDAVEVLDPGTLPRTSSGKLRRAEALGQYREGRLHAPRRVSPLSLALAFGRSALAFARHRRGVKKREAVDAHS